MEQPTKIYLIRHGQTEWNVKGIFQGQDDSPLTEEGLHQAHMIGEKFSHVPTDCIYSSDIGRAKTTAEIIAQYHKLEVKLSDLIRERYFGAFQGQRVKEVEQCLKQRIEESKDLSKAERLDFRLADDVETDQELMNRLYRFFQVVHDKHPQKTLLTVCHGDLMRTFLFYIDFARYGQLGRSSIDNLAYVIIETDGRQVDLIKVHGAHLRP